MTDTTHRGQEAAVGALQTWAEGVQRLCGWLPSRDSKMPSAAEVVDHYFDFAEHVLATQRHFTMSLLTATKAAHGDKGYGDTDKGDTDKGYGDKGYGDKSYGDTDKGYGDKSYGDT
ncbi:MAG TPA: hypothetical protein VK887_07080, partial [Pseudonocardiaceae bacterium]|nr:hypothetical protein [Pseudonocardiaceae bacterium]